MRPELKDFPIGVDITPKLPNRKFAEGIDFPKGIQQLDLDWITKQVTLGMVVNCRNDEELRELKAKATAILWLVELKAMSRKT